MIYNAEPLVNHVLVGRSVLSTETFLRDICGLRYLKKKGPVSGFVGHIPLPSLESKISVLLWPRPWA